MPELEKPNSPLTTTVKWRFPSVHPEGRKFVVIAAAITLVAYWIDWDFITIVLLGLTIWVAAFFRDPVRTTPRGANLIVAPADGLITMIEKVPVPAELGLQIVVGAEDDVGRADAGRPIVEGERAG